MAVKSSPVHFTQVHIIVEILQYIFFMEALFPTDISVDLNYTGYAHNNVKTVMSLIANDKKLMKMSPVMKNELI